MSLYIKGLELPERGEKIIVLTSSGYVEDVSGQVINGVEAFNVLPHGRLGDLDALQNRMETYSDYEGAIGYHDEDMICRDSVAYAIEQAPTIIPPDDK